MSSSFGNDMGLCLLVNTTIRFSSCVSTDNLCLDVALQRQDTPEIPSGDLLLNRIGSLLRFDTDLRNAAIGGVVNKRSIALHPS